MQLGFWEIVVLIGIAGFVFGPAPAPRVDTLSLPQYPCNPYCLAVHGPNSSQ